MAIMATWTFAFGLKPTLDYIGLYSATQYKLARWYRSDYDKSLTWVLITHDDSKYEFTFRDRKLVAQPDQALIKLLEQRNILFRKFNKDICNGSHI